jgi:septal ring factor EnvC (AmiA/AmiB activator)
VTRTDAQKDEIQKQDARQKQLGAVIDRLKDEHRRIWTETGEAKEKIASAEAENRSLRQQLSTAEKELQNIAADRDSLKAELGE